MPDTYIKPENVTSPKKHWSLIGVLRDSGRPGKASYAVGTWDGEVRIACRWNGHEGKPNGNPQSSARPTWMVLEPDASAGIVQALGLTDKLLQIIADQHAKLNP